MLFLGYVDGLPTRSWPAFVPTSKLLPSWHPAQRALPRDTGSASTLATWKRTIVTVCAGGVLAWLLAGAWLTWTALRADAANNLERMVRLIGKHAEMTFAITEVMAARVRDALGDEGTSADGLSTERERQIHQRLKEVAESVPQVDSIWVWNSDGAPLATTAGFPVPPGSSAADKDFFVFHKRPGSGLYVSELMYERNKADPLIYITRRREGSDGRFLGVIMISVSVRTFNDYYRDLTRNTALSLALVRSDGLILGRYPEARSPDDRDGRNEPRNNRLRYDQHLATASGRTEWSTAPLSAAPFLGRHATLTAIWRVPALPFYVTAGQHEEATLSTWLRQLARLGLEGVTTATLLGLFTWFMLRAGLRGQRLLGAWREEASRRAAAEDALRQAQKLEAIGQLTGGVAHDFNNLLMVVSTNLHIVKLKERGASIERELAAIGRAIANGQSLTRQLMAFSRRKAQQVEVVDLASHMPTVCDLIKHSLRPGITLECNVSPHTWPIEVDVSELELALLNLAVNARDAMPEGGAIEIQAGNLTLDGKLAAIDILVGEFVGIQVRDTGHGVPPEVLDRVFEPFFTTKDVGKGTGLGLPQVYGFARASGGTAMITSEPGAGTTVTLFLPRLGGSTSRLDPARQKTILVAESNPAVADSIAALLEQMGYRVRVTRDTLEALDTLTRGATCDLLLVDLAMQGGMSGIELVRLARARLPSLPMVLMSGFGPVDPRGREEGLTVLGKPFDVQALTNVLEARLGRAGRIT